MALMLISYDMHLPGQNYSKLHGAIKKLGTWRHDLGSTWVVRTSLDVREVWECLSDVFHRDGNVLIVDITDRPSSGWLPPDAWDWIGEPARHDPVGGDDDAKQDGVRR